MSRRMAAALAVAALLLALATPALADDVVRLVVTSTDVTAFPQVALTLAVSGPDGRPVVLDPSEIEVWVAGERLAATVSSSVEARPVDVVLVLDRSGSMAGTPLADATRAVGSFLARLGPRDRSALVGLSTRAEAVRALTTDRASVAAAATRLSASGDTALYDAVALAARQLDEGGRAQARQAILVLTDGHDTASATSPADLQPLVAHRAVHVVALGAAPDLDALKRLAAASSGGTVVRAPTSAQLDAIYASLAEKLRADTGVRFRFATEQYAPEMTVVVAARREGSVIGRTQLVIPLPVRIPDTGAMPATTAAPQIVPAVAMVTTPDASGRDRPLIAGLLASATSLALVAWALSAFGTAARHGAPIENVPLASPARRRGTSSMRARRTIRGIATGAARLTRSKPSPSADLQLDRAGRPFGLDPLELTGMRLIIVGGLAALAFGGAVVIGADGIGITASAAWGVVAGYALPTVVIRVATTARQTAIRRALPTTLDMLTLCVEAGLSLDGALAHVSRRSRGPLYDEIERLLLELQMGVDRRDALRHLALRCDVPEVTRLVNAMLQAEVLGVGIGRALQDQAQEVRTRRRQRAEALARTAPVKMLFPIVLLIFPAMFVVILGPAVPRLAAIFDVAR
ncbi:MAG: type II secretion system F family protein [Chloroflexota bacterium]|nr:type II secretion system F family protein [Chloroflexota bacterium]